MVTVYLLMKTVTICILYFVFCFANACFESCYTCFKYCHACGMLHPAHCKRSPGPIWALMLRQSLSACPYAIECMCKSMYFNRPIMHFIMKSVMLLLHIN